MNNCLENHVVQFSRILRSFGLPIGTSETMDALAALKFVELTNRSQFRSALRSTLVKDPVHHPVFENAFEAFFVEPEVREGQVKEHKGHLDAREQAKKELEFQTTKLDLDDRQLDLYLQLPNEVKEQMRDFVKRTAEGKNVSPRFKPILDNVINGALNFQRSQMKQPQLLPVELTGEDDIDAVLHQITAGNKEKDIFYRDMGNISEGEYAQTIALIRRLARRLASGISRRYKKSSKVHKIDIRRSIRAGIRFGGTMMELKYRQKKIQKPEIVFLCDVSGSMLKYAQFTIEFLQGLSDSLPRMHTFIFADELEKVDLAKFSPDRLTASKNWGEGTNIYKALKELKENYHSLLRKRTVVVVLSDTKSNKGEAASRHLQMIKNKVKDIIWLNPLPRIQWIKHPNVTLFQKHCSMWECSSLAHLSKVLSKNLI